MNNCCSLKINDFQLIVYVFKENEGHSVNRFTSIKMNDVQFIFHFREKESVRSFAQFAGKVNFERVNAVHEHEIMPKSEIVLES